VSSDRTTKRVHSSDKALCEGWQKTRTPCCDCLICRSSVIVCVVVIGSKARLDRPVTRELATPRFLACKTSRCLSCIGNELTGKRLVCQRLRRQSKDPHSAAGEAAPCLSLVREKIWKCKELNDCLTENLVEIDDTEYSDGRVKDFTSETTGGKNDTNSALVLIWVGRLTHLNHVTFM
jgi:hypothetical protein